MLVGVDHRTRHFLDLVDENAHPWLIQVVGAFAQLGCEFAVEHENGVIVPPSASVLKPSTRSLLQTQSFLQQNGPVSVATAQTDPALQ